MDADQHAGKAGHQASGNAICDGAYALKPDSPVSLPHPKDREHLAVCPMHRQSSRSQHTYAPRPCLLPTALLPTHGVLPPCQDEVG